MLSLAINFDEFLTTTDVVDEVFLQVQGLPQLIEIGDLQFAAQFDRTGFRGQFSQQNF